jgi:hypothetical protein
MIRKLSFLAFVLGLSFSLNAQTTETKEEKKSPLVFTGSADGYFRTDFSGATSNNKTSFTNSNNKLASGIISAKADLTLGKFSFTADLGAGKRASEFAYNDKGALSYVKQLYASLSLTDWLKLTAGTWATHVGYEVVDAYVNRNYSMSYMFSYGPFLHTGAKADLTFGKTGLMIGISKPTDFRKSPEGSKSALLLQFSQALSDDTKLYINFVGGKRPSDGAGINQFDVVFTNKFSDKFNIGLNATLNNTSGKTWSGIASYLNLDPTEKIGFTLRTELFNDKNQLSALSTAAKGASIIANTLSANVKLGPITLIPEIRVESAGAKVFSSKSGSAQSGTGSFLIAAVYKFSK